MEAGEIPDPVVLDCIVSGLLRSVDESAAKEVYKRMEACRQEATKNMAGHGYFNNKVISKVLVILGKLARPPRHARGVSKRRASHP